MDFRTHVLQDHCVRVINGSSSQAGAEVAFQAAVDAPVGALCAFGGGQNGFDKVKMKREAGQDRLRV